MPIVRNVLREHKIQRIMQRRADSALPIVVIHGDGIEGLEIRQAIEDEQSEVPPQPRFELAPVMDGRAVVPQCENEIGSSRTKREIGQQALPITRGDIGIPLVAVKEVFAVKRHVGHGCPDKRDLYRAMASSMSALWS